MSEETASYEVIENLRRIERARQEAWAEARRMEAAGRSIDERRQAAARKYGQGFAVPVRTQPSRPPDSCDLGDIESYVVRLREHCQAAEVDLARAVAAAETRLLLAEIGRQTSGLSRSEELFGLTGRSGGEPGDAASKNDSASREQDVTRIVGRLHGEIVRAQRTDIEGLAREILQTRESGRAAALISELRLRVQRANDAAEAEARSIARAAAARDGLRGLGGEDVAAVIAALTDVESRRRPLTEELLSRVRQVEAAAGARADSAYAAEVIREELERLGYEIGDDFESVFAGGGELRFGRPEIEDYRVVMRTEPRGGRMDVRLARLGRSGEAVSAEQKRQDEDAEESWCRDFAQLRRALQGRRVASRVLRRLPPRSHQLAVIEKGDRDRQKRRKKPHLAQRQH